MNGGRGGYTAENMSVDTAVNLRELDKVLLWQLQLNLSLIAGNHVFIPLPVFLPLLYTSQCILSNKRNPSYCFFNLNIFIIKITILRKGYFIHGPSFAMVNLSGCQSSMNVGVIAQKQHWGPSQNSHSQKRSVSTCARFSKAPQCRQVADRPRPWEVVRCWFSTLEAVPKVCVRMYDLSLCRFPRCATLLGLSLEVPVACHRVCRSRSLWRNESGGQLQKLDSLDSIVQWLGQAGMAKNKNSAFDVV